jgi:hypothetical protein
MMLIPFGVRRRRTAWCAQPADSRRLAGAYGTYCSAIFTTWS